MLQDEIEFLESKLFDQINHLEFQLKQNTERLTGKHYHRSTLLSSLVSSTDQTIAPLQILEKMKGLMKNGS